jgi:hypothetical protein
MERVAAAGRTRIRSKKSHASIVQESIRQGVAKAIAGRSVLRVQPLARRIAEACPRCGMTFEAIAEEIARAGMAAEVPLDVGKAPADQKASAPLG